jgi:RNA-directed DNA polymerase
VMEDGCVTHPEAGTPQGGVVSPLLANIYLHEVLDCWFESEVQPRLKGRAFLIRYADDLLIGFSSEEDAHRVKEVLPKRFGRYGLTLHPEKTRLVPFRPKRGKLRPGELTPEPGSFDFLGFTHYWGLSRKGSWVIKRKTAKGRLGRALQRVAEWCRRVLHRPVKEQHQELSRKLRGHYAYYGLTGNAASLSRFYHEVTKSWRRWLARRSQRGMDWERFNRMMKTFALPTPVVIHSYQRHAAKP